MHNLLLRCNGALEVDTASVARMVRGLSRGGYACGEHDTIIIQLTCGEATRRLAHLARVGREERDHLAVDPLRGEPIAAVALLRLELEVCTLAVGWHRTHTGTLFDPCRLRPRGQQGICKVGRAVAGASHDGAPAQAVAARVRAAMHCC